MAAPSGVASMEVATQKRRSLFTIAKAARTSNTFRRLTAANLKDEATRLAEENSMRISTEVQQVLINLSAMLNLDHWTEVKSQEARKSRAVCLRQKPDAKALLPRFQAVVHRIIDKNRTLTAQFLVQKFVFKYVTGDERPAQPRTFKSRNDIIGDIRSKQDFWGTIHMAYQHTSKVSGERAASPQLEQQPVPQAGVVDEDESRETSPTGIRNFRTLPACSPRVWASEVRSNLGLGQVVHHQRDPASQSTGFDHYLDLLYFEQERKSAVPSSRRLNKTRFPRISYLPDAFPRTPKDSLAKESLPECQEFVPPSFSEVPALPSLPCTPGGHGGQSLEPPIGERRGSGEHRGNLSSRGSQLGSRQGSRASSSRPSRPPSQAPFSLPTVSSTTPNFRPSHSPSSAEVNPSCIKAPTLSIAHGSPPHSRGSPPRSARGGSPPRSARGSVNSRGSMSSRQRTAKDSPRGSNVGIQGQQVSVDHQSQRGSAVEAMTQTWPSFNSKVAEKPRSGSRRTRLSQAGRIETPRRQEAACAVWERAHKKSSAFKAQEERMRDKSARTTGSGLRWTSLTRKDKLSNASPSSTVRSGNGFGAAKASSTVRSGDRFGAAKRDEELEEIVELDEPQPPDPSPLEQRLPEFICLEGSPMRRHDAKRVLANVAEDRLLCEYGPEVGPSEFLEDNEERLEVRYFRNCTKLSTLPSRLKFLSSLNDSGSGNAEVVATDSELTNEKVIAMGRAVASKAKDICCIDLSGSRLLTDDPLATFISSLRPGCTSLRELKLDETKLGRRGLHELSQAMVKTFRLESLSLAGVHIADDSWPPLCQSVASSSRMQSLDVSNTTLGMWQQYACGHVAAMVSQTRSLKKLCVSQNHFRQVGLDALANALTEEMTILETLCLNDNGCGDNNNVLATLKATEGEGNKPSVWHPIVTFCEALRNNRSLTDLELNNSQLNTMAAVCLEDTFLVHPRLRRIDVGRNPFGEFGLRSILRSAIRRQSALEAIVVAGFRDDVGVPPLLFNYGDLTEDYCGEKALPLESPYGRSICRLLLNRIDDFGQMPGDGMQKFKMNNESRKPPFTKNAAGHWQVPSSGKVEFDFVLIQEGDVKDADELVVVWQNSRRIPVSMMRFVAVVMCWRSLLTEQEHRTFVDAVGKDCLLKAAQMRLFVEEAAMYMPSLVPRITSRLMLSLQSIDRQCVNSTLKATTKKAADEVDGNQPRSSVTGSTALVESSNLRAFKKQKGYGKGGDQSLSYMSSLLRFNPQNCSGRYRLDLRDPADYTVAERVLVINNWESLIARARKVVDTSQAGSYHAIRNIKFEGEGTEEFMYTSSWMLPGDGFSGEGHLQIDYVSMVRVHPARDTALSEEQFDILIGLLRQENTDCLEVSVFLAIKLVSHKLVLLAEQLGKMLRCLLQMERRIECYHFLFPRCLEFGPPMVDLDDGLLGRGAGLFSELDRGTLTHRLGLAHTMDAINMHREPRNVFVLDLTRHDTHAVCEYLIFLAEIEPGENMVDCHWTEYSNRTSGMWFVPASWTEAVPRKGCVSITYVLQKLEYLRLDVRKENAVKMLGWLVTDFGQVGAPLQ